MQKEDEKAFETLRLHFADITGSSLDPTVLAAGLFAADIIGKARVEEASNPAWPNHQTKRTNILSEVMNSGKPGAFRDFVLLVLKMEQCVWLGEKLIETYKQKGGLWVEIPPTQQQRVTSTQSSYVSYTCTAPVLKDLMHLRVNDWYRLGLALNLDSYDLDIIRKDNQGDAKTQTLKMFQLWLTRQPQASYMQLIQALHEVGDERVVTFLCGKYGIVPPVSAGASSQMHQTSPAAVYVSGGSQPQPSYPGGGAKTHPPNPGYALMQQPSGPSQMPPVQGTGSTMPTQQPPGYAPMQQPYGPSQMPPGQAMGSAMPTQQPPYPQPYAGYPYQPYTGYPYQPSGSHSNVHPSQYSVAPMAGPRYPVHRIPNSETILKPGDMKILKPLIQPVAAYWVAIADQLGMESHVATIQGTPGNISPPACLRDLLNRWLNQEGYQTLEALCQALRDDPEIVGGAGVAANLEEKFQSRRGNVPQHTNQSTTRQLLYTQQMDPGYLPNTTEYLPQQGHYHDGNYPPPTQPQPEGSFCPVNILPSRHTGLAGQGQVEGHSCQDADEYAGLRYEPEMKDLLNEIAVKLPDKWCEIGRGLGLEEYKLKQIQAEHGWQQSTNKFFSAMFDKWYSGVTSPYTWEQVVRVLYQPCVGGNRVADELKRKYWRT